METKKEGELKDSKKFHCFDTACGIRLTFYGWDFPEVSHRFTIQNRETTGHHIHGCMAMENKKEEKKLGIL